MQISKMQKSKANNSGRQRIYYCNPKSRCEIAHQLMNSSPYAAIYKRSRSTLSLPPHTENPNTSRIERSWHFNFSSSSAAAVLSVSVDFVRLTMETNSNSSGMKSNALEYYKEDRFSQLPDDVIGHILSFVPIKKAIQTSVLAKRWTKVWTLVTSVEFHDIIRNTRSCIDFVDHVLDNCTAMKIDCFAMVLDRSVFPHRVTEWVNKITRRNLLELRLEGSVFPKSIFTCQTLKVLKLFSDSLDLLLDVPNSFHLPNLKILHICVDYIPSSSLLTNSLSSGCPLLEDLTLQGVAEIDVTFVLSCPFLKRLKIHLVPFNLQGLRCELRINAPNLEFLEIFDISTAEYVVEKLPLVVEAKMEIGEAPLSPMYAGTAYKLLWACSSSKFLALDQVYLSVLASAFPIDLPAFVNMNRLELHVNYSTDSQVVAYFLNACPKLEVLIFHQDYLQFSFVEYVNYFNELSGVPPCLLSHMKVIKFDGFEGSTYQFDFVRDQTPASTESFEDG